MLPINPATTKRNKSIPVPAPTGLKDKVDARLDGKLADLKLSRSGLVRILLKEFIKGEYNTKIGEAAGAEKQHGRGLDDVIPVSIDERLKQRAERGTELLGPRCVVSLAAVIRILLTAFVRGECDEVVRAGAAAERRRPSRVSKKKAQRLATLTPHPTAPHPSTPEPQRMFVLVRQDNSSSK